MPAAAAIADVGGKQRLDVIEQRPGNDSVMLTRVILAMVDDVAAVDAVLQEIVEPASAERIAAADATISHGLGLGHDATAAKILKQGSHRAELEVALEYVPDGLRFGLIDDQLAVPRLIPKRNAAAHPHSLGFRGCNLIPHPLGDNFAFELSK